MKTLNLSFWTRGLLRESYTEREIHKAQVPVFSYMAVRAQCLIWNAWRKNHNKRWDWIIQQHWFAWPNADLEFICLCCSESEPGRRLDSVIPVRNWIQTNAWLQVFWDLCKQHCKNWVDWHLICVGYMIFTNMTFFMRSGFDLVKLTDQTTKIKWEKYKLALLVKCSFGHWLKVGRPSFSEFIH